MGAVHVFDQVLAPVPDGSHFVGGLLEFSQLAFQGGEPLFLVLDAPEEDNHAAQP